MSHDVSADELRRRLTDELEGVLDAFCPGWVEHKGSAWPAWVSKADPGSWQVYLRPVGKQKRGDWFRRSAGVGGDVISLVAYAETGNHKATADTFRRAREFLGIEARREEGPEAAAQREKRAAEAKAKRERDEAEAALYAVRRLGDARGIWQSTIALAGSLAEIYLQHRGIPVPPTGWPEVLRFHPMLPYELDPSKSFPALVAKVQGVDGRGAGVWRIYLRPDGRDKAPVAKAKVGVGMVGGGAVRIGGDAPHIGAAEGVESALAQWALKRWRMPVWATLSTSGMMALEPPLFVERITVYADGDKPTIRSDGSLGPRPGMAAGRALKARMDEAHIRCDVPRPPMAGDALDVLVAARQREAW